MSKKTNFSYIMVKPTTIVVIVGVLTIAVMLGLLGYLMYKYFFGVEQRKKVQEVVQEEIIDEPPTVQIETPSQWWQDEDAIFA